MYACIATKVLLKRFINEPPNTSTMRQLKQNLVSAIIIIVINLIASTSSYSQFCDSLVPSTVVDLSASPNMNWISAPFVRDGNCCGTSSPDKCLEFIITLHPSAIAVSFNIASGAIPPGALFYQIDCGPPTPVGSPICLTGPGPHTLTFCKPGNNSNTFSITSYSSPVIGPDITLNTGCQGYIYANYYNEASINWTSIGPGIPGAYDYLLSCTGGCDTSYITAPVNPPAYVDYLVCGMDIGGCNPLPICDTIRVNFISGVTVNISALTTSLCIGETTTLTANASGGVAPYLYVWNTAEVSSSIIVGPGTYYVDVVDTSGCYVATDTMIILQFTPPVIIAGADQIVCEGTPITLNGSGGISYSWDNGVVDGIPFAQAPGFNTYTVIGTDINGCTNTDSVVVTVNSCGNPPIAGFSSTDSTICVGDCIDFNDLSSGGPTGWNWYFFGATPNSSSAQNPTSICYNTVGNFDVALVSTNPNGYVLTANYSGGSIGLLKLNSKGELSSLLDIQQHSGKGIGDRQEVPHAHSAWFEPSNIMLSL